MPAASDIMILEDWDSPLWRIDNIYRITTDEGKEIPFKLNEQQWELLRNLWYWNNILKGRQQGFSTAIGIFALDQSLFRSNFRSGIIAQTEDDVKKLFRNKIQRPYESLPQDLRNTVGLKTQNKTEFEFGNGSSIRVGMSMRSDTLQLLHVSEFGKICAKFPERAREIVTGAFETLAPGNLGFIESTAEGSSGYFYDYCMEDLRKLRAGEKLSMLDRRLHFFAWWRKPSNRLDPAGVVIDANFVKYFQDLQLKHGIFLDAEQKAWYVKKAQTLKGDMTREHPSYPEEAFEHAIEGAIFQDEMTWLRKHGRITTVPWDASYPVNTYWDLGLGDANAIWFHQKIGTSDRFIDHMELTGKGMGFIAGELKQRDYVYGWHALPHDGDQRLQAEVVETREAILNRLGIKPVKIIPRIPRKKTGIDLTKGKFSSVWIDREKCALGIKALDNYQRVWNERLGKFEDEPLHNWASNSADAFMQWGQDDVAAPATNAPPPPKFKAPPNWRTR